MAAALGLALSLLAALRVGNGELNVRELSDMAYGVEISREPVMAGQVPEPGGHYGNREAEPSLFLQAQEKGREQQVEKSPETPGPKEPPSPEPPSSDPPGPEEEEEVEEEEEEDAELLGGFEKELGGGVLLPREQMAQLKEEVKTEMEKEFDNIINEVGAGGPRSSPLTPPDPPIPH
uniref:Uncharacterized protein n=1 Tax=Coturnix japonica TaxID=93934 RepID=A0A8C2SYV5_COTJA